MPANHLRLFPSSEESPVRVDEQEANVPVRMHELISMVRQAIKGNYAWLRDFENDEVRVTQDFFDVIRAFSRLRPSA